MKRIDLGFKVFRGLARCEITYDHCPYEADKSLPDYDMGTFKFTERKGDDRGCRGILCDECWDIELES